MTQSSTTKLKESGFYLITDIRNYLKEKYARSPAINTLYSYARNGCFESEECGSITLYSLKSVESIMMDEVNRFKAWRAAVKRNGGARV